jgi:hypothetical protein
MKATAAQYMNEFVSLTILVLMAFALIAGQAAASGDSRSAALVETRHEVSVVPARLERTADARIAPLINALPAGAGSLRGHILSRTEREGVRRPAVR